MVGNIGGSEMARLYAALGGTQCKTRDWRHPSGSWGQEQLGMGLSPGRWRQGVVVWMCVCD